MKNFQRNNEKIIDTRFENLCLQIPCLLFQYDDQSDLDQTDHRSWSTLHHVAAGKNPSPNILALTPPQGYDHLHDVDARGPGKTAAKIVSLQT